MGITATRERFGHEPRKVLRERQHSNLRNGTNRPGDNFRRGARRTRVRAVSEAGQPAVRVAEAMQAVGSDETAYRDSHIDDQIDADDAIADALSRSGLESDAPDEAASEYRALVCEADGCIQGADVVCPDCQGNYCYGDEEHPDHKGPNRDR
jgi:hypothetical protein